MPSAAGDRAQPAEEVFLWQAHWPDLRRLPRVNNYRGMNYGDRYMFRLRQLRRVLGAPSRLADQLNEIMRDPDLRQSRPEVVFAAVEAAGAYRLAECVPALIELEQASFMPEPDPMHFVPQEDEDPVTYALIHIGDRALQAVLEAAANPTTGDTPLADFGIVVENVTGDPAIAQAVVEAFLRKYGMPHTRAMLKRYPFCRCWLPREEVDRLEAAEQQRLRQPQQQRNATTQPLTGSTPPPGQPRVGYPEP